VAEALWKVAKAHSHVKALASSLTGAACYLPTVRWPSTWNLDRASKGWRGVNTTPDGLRLLHDLRWSLLQPPLQLRPHTPTADDATTDVRATA
jgi:hypothetical protein